MRYGSICSGIEAATAAWHPLGWEPAFFSEIDRFPREVLAHHYPDVPLHGDFTTIRKSDYGSIDLLVGGTPCQSFSVAGLRKGMADHRGQLALEFLLLTQRKRPLWLVWENVPGVLSANGGRDFGSLLGGMVELGYGFAYRVLDAQYFGVPQRRRRVFVVGYLGDWRPPVQVLFEHQSLRRDPPPRRQTREGTAGRIAPCLGESSGNARPGDNVQSVEYLVPEVANPLTARMHKGINSTLDEGQTPLAFSITNEIAGALTVSPSTSRSPNEDSTLVAFQSNASADQAAAAGEEVSPTMVDGDPPAVAFSIMPMNSGKDYKARETDVAQPLMTQPVGGNQGGDYVANNMAVRRLSPRECERLQGFPDDFTRIPYRGKEAEDCPDGPRYKALGNSMAVPVMRWIGERIDRVEHPNKPNDEQRYRHNEVYRK